MSFPTTILESFSELVERHFVTIGGVFRQRQLDARQHLGVRVHPDQRERPTCRQRLLPDEFPGIGFFFRRRIGGRSSWQASCCRKDFDLAVGLDILEPRAEVVE